MLNGRYLVPITALSALLRDLSRAQSSLLKTFSRPEKGQPG